MRLNLKQSFAALALTVFSFTDSSRVLIYKNHQFLEVVTHFTSDCSSFIF